MRDKVSYIKHIPGHEDSNGESAPWVICQHNTDKVISSHKTKQEAEEHLRDIHIHKGGKMIYREATDLNELLEKSKEDAKTKDLDDIPLAIFEDTDTAIDELIQSDDREHEVSEEHRDIPE